jgi:hypothetical protein
MPPSFGQTANAFMSFNLLNTNALNVINFHKKTTITKFHSKSTPKISHHNMCYNNLRKMSCGCTYLRRFDRCSYTPEDAYCCDVVNNLTISGDSPCEFCFINKMKRASKKRTSSQVESRPVSANGFHAALVKKPNDSQRK